VRSLLLLDVAQQHVMRLSSSAAVEIKDMELLS
jgi:hypothetical protein